MHRGAFGDLPRRYNRCPTPMPGLSEIEDFELACLVLEGRADALDELLSRAAVPAFIATKLALSFLERAGYALKDPGVLEAHRTGFDLLAALLEDDRRYLRAMPDGATLKEWLQLVALVECRERSMLDVGEEAEAEPQGELPLVESPDGRVTSRQAFVLALVGDGCAASAVARVLGMPLAATVSLTHDARRRALGATGDEPESPCGVTGLALSALLDGAVQDESRGPLRRHVARCPACGKRIRALRAAPARVEATKPEGRPARARSRCPSLALLYRYGRRQLPHEARAAIESHAAGCRECRHALVFDRAWDAPAVEVNLPSDVMAAGRRRIEGLAVETPAIVGFGINDEACRVLYTSGERGTDLFASGSRTILCEGASLLLESLQVQVKCLPDEDPTETRCSIGAVFQGLSERLPVFLELEGEGEKQVTLRDNAVEFLHVRAGSHVLRFGKWKGRSVLVDVKPYHCRFDDLLQVSDALCRKAEEAAGQPLEVTLFYRVSDLCLRAAAERPGDGRALLRLLRAYFAKPVPRVDGALLSDGSARAADRAAYVRFLDAGAVRAIGWIRAASADSELGQALRPLAAVFSARASQDVERLLESLTALRAYALPSDPETDRYARTLADWLREPGHDRDPRADLMSRLGLKYVAGLIRRFDERGEER